MATPERYKPFTVRRPAAAALLGIGRTKLDSLIANGEIQAKKSGRSLLIVVASIEKYIDGLPRAKLKDTIGNYGKKLAS
jgi:excisionase family DNA binding protein